MSRTRKQAVSLINRRLNKLVGKWETTCGDPVAGAEAADYQCEFIELIEHSLDEAFFRGVKRGNEQASNHLKGVV